jgi:hypothetical protein
MSLLVYMAAVAVSVQSENRRVMKSVVRAFMGMVLRGSGSLSDGCVTQAMRRDTLVFVMVFTGAG